MLKPLCWLELPFRLSANQKTVSAMRRPKSASQVWWLLANPLQAHHIGSKVTGNRYMWMQRLPIKSGGFANPYARFTVASDL